MKTTNQTKDVILKKLDHLKSMDNFGSSVYPEIDKLINDIVNSKSSLLSKKELDEIKYYYGDDFINNTLIGSALLKRFGYAGDFLMIDKIYTRECSDDPFFKSWDNFFLDHPAAKAVRNRKEYFKKLINHKLESNPTISLLNVASGPARDLKELYEVKGRDKHLKTICVDMDDNAIKYAKQLMSPFSSEVDFFNKNIFRFNTDSTFDVIWSAGLFDYFDDKTFVFVLKKFKEWISIDGEIIVGNFNSAHNPSRAYMELFGEWYLHHRSKNELIQLAKKAGFDSKNITIGSEEENVNLFLHIRK